MKIYIKNMACPRYIMVIQKELEALDLCVQSIELGAVAFDRALSEEQVSGISDRITPLGFELLNDARNRLVEEIKNRLIQVVQWPNWKPISVSRNTYLPKSIRAIPI